MKKITLIIVILLQTFENVFSQANFLVKAPMHNSTTQVRAPNGTANAASMRACVLVLASELTNIQPGSQITTFGFTLSNTPAMVSMPVSGNFTVYLENTSDVTYSKGVSFTTAITGMATVYNSTMTIPIATTTSSITLTLSAPFTYTGGGIYVAYDWYSTGPYSAAANPATYHSESVGLNPGCASASSAGLPANDNLTNTAFRPTFLFGGVNSYTNEIECVGIESAPGRVAAMFNSPHTISALIKNSSNVAKNNVPVNLNVTGANLFTDVQTIPTLASGASTIVNFAAFNPTILGTNTINVSVPSDENNSNNLSTYIQSVTCNEWAQNPAVGNYSANSVGWNTGSGIIACTYTNPVTSTLTSIRGAISNNAPSVGNQSWGVLMNAAGAIVATTNTITITAGMLSTFQTYTFTSPQNLTPNTLYYLGFAQPANTIGYFPAGTSTVSYLSNNFYYTTTLAGGVLTPLGQNLGYFGIEGIFAPSINMTAASQTINCGSSATLSASGANTYSWNTSTTSSSIIVSPLTSTNYVVTGTDLIGCSMSKTVSVNVTPISVLITSSSQSICAGESATLTASGASSFSWTIGTNTLTTATVIVSPTTTSAFLLVGSDPSGCTSATNGVVLVQPLPTVSINSNSNTICLGQSVSLNANGASSFQWVNTGASGNNIVDTPTLTTTYTVVGTSSAGCINESFRTVTVNSFTPSITNPSSICNGDALTITAGDGAVNSYTWSNGITQFGQINVSPTITTIYSVSALGATNNCLGINATTITVNALPVLTISATNTVICRNESATITVSGANTYSWSNGATTSSILISSGTAGITNYSISGTSSANCTSGTSFLFKVDLCTSVLENSVDAKQQLTVYPNPTQNSVLISLKSDLLDNSKIEIYDALGRLVVTKRMSSSSVEVDLSSLQNGIYVIKLQVDGENRGSTKLIKH